MEIKRDIHLRRLIKSKHNGMIKVVTGTLRVFSLEYHLS